MRKQRKTALCAAAVFAAAMIVSPMTRAFAEPGGGYGEYARAAISGLDAIAPRTAGTEGERRAAEWISGEIEKMGFAARTDAFSYGKGSASRNVAAVKKGQSERTVVVTAHYDCADTGRGADDNASGVAVALETMKRLLQAETPYTVEFLFCGAEEAGKEGSKHYVSSLTPEQKAKIVCNINLDSLIAGDFMYIYGGNNGRQSKSDCAAVTRRWVYDQAFEIASALGLETRSNPGADRGTNPLTAKPYDYYPFPTAGTWGDHDPFDEAGIPYLCLESANWDLPPYDGSAQTALRGRIMHTGRDSAEEIEKLFPGRLRSRAEVYTRLLEALLLGLREPDGTPWEDKNIDALKPWEDISPSCSVYGSVIAIDLGAPFETHASAPTKENFRLTDASGAEIPLRILSLDGQSGKIILAADPGRPLFGRFTVRYTKYASLIVKEKTKSYAPSFEAGFWAVTLFRFIQNRPCYGR